MVKQKKIETIGGINAFLYTAAKTECLNILRHEKYKQQFRARTILDKERQLNQEILESFQFDSLEFIELEKMINNALQKLPERCRLVFEKSRFEGKKNREIAEELDIALKSVESNITRAIKILRKELQEVLPLVIWMF